MWLIFRKNIFFLNSRQYGQAICCKYKKITLALNKASFLLSSTFLCLCLFFHVFLSFLLSLHQPTHHPLFPTPSSFFYCVWQELLLTMLHLTLPPTPHTNPRPVCLTVYLGAAGARLTVWLSCVGHIYVCVFACVCLHWAGPLLLFPSPPLPTSTQPKHSGLPRLHCLSRSRPLLLLLLFAHPPSQVPVLLQSSMPLWPARTTAQASL